MMTIFSWQTTRRLRSAIGVCILSVPMLAACEKPTLPVSLHGVNYSESEFSYVLVDPANPKNTGGSESIGPYAAGGTNCCYELPRQWRAGMMVTINSTYSVGKLADNTLHDVPATQTVEVPRYPNGKPGELWVLRGPDGKMDLVSSDFQPDHPDWPGKVKGWPVPSLAYQRARWDIDIKYEKDGVAMYEKLLAELKSAPDARAGNAWNSALSNDKESIKGYSGPNDLKFREMLKREYEEGLQRSRSQMDRLVKGRP
jgi:hypothetical protein